MTELLIADRANSFWRGIGAGVADRATSGLSSGTLRISKWDSGSRNNGVNLNNDTISSTIYASLTTTGGATPTDVLRVQFYIDGVLHQTENDPPFDLSGGSTSFANGYSTFGLSNGAHVFRADYWLSGTNPDVDAASGSVTANVTVSNTSSPTGVLVTPQELSVWRNRVSDPAYNADWQLILNNASNFVEGSTITQQPSNPVVIGSPKPTTDERHMMRYWMAACFKALVNDDASLGASCANHLDQQLSTGYDFGESSIWGKVNDGGGHSPWFTWASHSSRLLNGYEFIKTGGWVSGALETKLVNWAYDGSDLFTYFVADKYNSLANRFSNGSWDDYDGKETPGSKECNNRILDELDFTCHSAFKSNFQAGKDAAKDFALGCIRAAWDESPILYFADLHRGGTALSSVTQCSYHGSVIGNVIAVADAFRRHGDTSIFDYTSPEGQTLAGWCRFWARIALGELDDPLGYDTHYGLENKMPTHIYTGQVQQYINDDKVNAALQMPYPSNPSSNGPNTYREGPSGIWPAVQFMFKDVDPGVA